MAVDKNEFFRQATLLICGYLEIEEAMASCLGYLKEFMPADVMYLLLDDIEYDSMRIIAQATPSGGEKMDRLTPLPEEDRAIRTKLRAYVENGKKLPVFIDNHPEKSPVSRIMVEDLNTPNKSLMILWLAIEGSMIGNVVIESDGKDQYSEEHGRLLTLLSEPFAIAVSNYLKHKEVLILKDKLMEDNRYLHQEMKRMIGEDIIGENFGLKNVMEMVRQVAPLDSPVLLLGETGVGKDVVANALQAASSRRDGPFVTVNCGAIPETLLDSELFGHEKGAFTGALAAKKGLFERADEGTIFLDEIGELPAQAQVRLLRVLQNQEIERVGGTAPIQIDIRVIAATNRDLEEMVKSNNFREDLWFRLNVFPIVIPSLRNRKTDIPSLVQHFIGRKSRKINRPDYPFLAPGAIDALMDYHWPGNVRELENIIERALILNQGEPLVFDSLLKPPRSDSETQAHQVKGFLSLDEMISRHIARAINQCKGKIHGIGGAAELLGLNANTLRSKMKKLGMKTHPGH